MGFRAVLVCCVLLGAVVAIQPDSVRKSIKIREAPYFAWMHIPAKAERDSCGATIIGTQWVLTARHCLPSAWINDDFVADLQVVVGTDNWKDIKASHKVDAAYVYNDPRSDQRYTRGEPSRHDILLLHLQTSITESDTVKIAKLPRKSLTAAQLKNGLRLAGFGSKMSGEIEDELQTSSKGPIAPLISPDDVVKQLTSENSGHRVVPKSVYAYLPKDTGAESSQGDSGSGYVLKKKKGGFVVHGVVSSALGNFKIVVNVAFYTAWIKNVMANNADAATLRFAVSFNPPPASDFEVAADRAKWGAMDGCDCALKAANGKTLPADPDCSYPTTRNSFGAGPRGCDAGKVCQGGVCESPPSGTAWACPPLQYMDGKACDQGCGTIADPDCEFKDMEMPIVNAKCDSLNERGAERYTLAGDHCELAKCCRAENNFCQWVDRNDKCSALTPYKSWKFGKAKPFTTADASHCPHGVLMNEVKKCRKQKKAKGSDKKKSKGSKKSKSSSKGGLTQQVEDAMDKKQGKGKKAKRSKKKKKKKKTKKEKKDKSM